MALDIPDSFSNSVVVSSFAFLILVWFMVNKTLFSIKIKRKKILIFSITTLLILIIWFGAVFILGKSGFFAKNPLFAPNIIFAFLILFDLLRRFYNSKTAINIAESVSTPWIISIQSYRIVGVGFLILYNRGLLPASIAFSAGFGDIIVGVTAPFIALFYYLKKPFSRKLAIVWNIIGIIDLIIALTIGFVGFPRPIQFVSLTPSTEPMSLFPLVFITLFAVPLALVLHFFSLRILLNNNK